MYVSCVMGATALSTVGMNSAWCDLSQSWHSILRVVNPLNGHLRAPPALPLCFRLIDFSIHLLIIDRKRNNNGWLLVPRLYLLNADTLLTQLKIFRAKIFWRETACAVAGSLSRSGLFWCYKPKYRHLSSNPGGQESPPQLPSPAAITTHHKRATLDKNPHEQFLGLISLLTAEAPTVSEGINFKSGVVVPQQEKACILAVSRNFLETSHTHTWDISHTELHTVGW